MGVAEPVDPEHLGDDLGVVGLRERHHAGQQQVGVDQFAEFGEIDTIAELRCDRGEHVTSGERGADRRKVPVGVVQFDCALGATCQCHSGSQQAVVGPDEDALPAGHLDGDGPSSGGYAGVDDREHHTGRYVADAASERERPGANVEGGNAVGEVDDPGVRGQIADHRVHDTDEFIGGAVVREERHRLVTASHGANLLRTGARRDKGQCQPPDGTSPVGATRRFRRKRLHGDHHRTRKVM